MARSTKVYQMPMSVGDTLTQEDDVMIVEVVEKRVRERTQRLDAAVAGARRGHDLNPMPDDRLAFERRDAVEHHRMDTRSAGPSGQGRKAARVERQLETLKGEPAAPDAPT